MKNYNRYLTIGLVLLLLAVVFFYFSNIVAYVTIAWVFSMLGLPVRNFFMRFRIGKIQLGTTPAAILTMLMFILVFTVLFSVLVPPIVDQAQNLTNINYGNVEKALSQPLKQLTDLGHKYGFIPRGKTAMEQFEAFFKGQVTAEALSTIFNTIFVTASTLFAGLVAVSFITFFFLQDQSLFVGFMASIVPVRHDNRVRDTIDDVRTMLTRYFGGIMLQLFTVVLVLSILLWSVGAKNVLLMAFLYGLFNVIPYLGPIIGATLGILISISSNLDQDFYSYTWPLLIKVLFTYFAIQMIDGFFIQPYIFSKRVLAHPLEIFLIILIGADLYGPLGMILAVPTYTVIRVIARTFFNEYRFVQRLTENLDDQLGDEDCVNEPEGR